MTGKTSNQDPEAMQQSEGKVFRENASGKGVSVRNAATAAAESAERSSSFFLAAPPSDLCVISKVRQAANVRGDRPSY